VDRSRRIKPVVFAQFGQRNVRHFPRNALSRQFLRDPEARGTRSNDLRPRELSREIAVVEQALVNESRDRRIDVRRGLILPKQLSTQFRNGTRAESQHGDRSVVRRMRTHWRTRKGRKATPR